MTWAGAAATVPPGQQMIRAVRVVDGSHVPLAGVQVASADWGREGHMLKTEQADFDIRLWPLLKGDVVLSHLVLRKPEVAVELGPEGQLNWSLGESPVATEAAKAVAPKQRYQTPLVGQPETTDGRVADRDPHRKLELDGTVSTATGQAGAQPQAELSLKGRLENQPLALHFTGGSALMLRNTSEPYPLDLEIAYAGTSLTAKGTVQDPFVWTGANVALTLNGPNLDQISSMLGIHGPP